MVAVDEAKDCLQAQKGGVPQTLSQMTLFLVTTRGEEDAKAFETKVIYLRSANLILIICLDCRHVADSGRCLLWSPLRNKVGTNRFQLL